MKLFLFFLTILFNCNLCISQNNELNSLGPEPITNLEIFQVAEEQIHKYEKLISGKHPNFVRSFLSNDPENFLQVAEIFSPPFVDSLYYYNNITYFDSLKTVNKMTYMKIFICDSCNFPIDNQKYHITITTWYVEDENIIGSNYFSIEGFICLFGDRYIWREGEWKLHPTKCY